MRRLAQEVKKLREHPEHKNLDEKELLKKSLMAFVPPPDNPPAHIGPTSPLPKDIQSASPETQLEIEYLLDLALHEGLHKAHKEALASNPFVLDAFHDMLVGKLYPELKRRGILK